MWSYKDLIDIFFTLLILLEIFLEKNSLYIQIKFLKSLLQIARLLQTHPKLISYKNSAM